jgi:hypothetical protein
MSELEELLASDLGRKLSDSFDRQILVDLKYIDYNKLTGPVAWYFTNLEVKQWCEETLPDCFYHSNTLYYMNEADATLFRLKWL